MILYSSDLKYDKPTENSSPRFEGVEGLIGGCGVNEVE